MSFDFKTILLYIICLLIPILIFKIFHKPLAWAFRFLISCIVGGLALFVLNLLLMKSGFQFAINPFNALIVGTLGLPGIAVLIFFTSFL